MIRRLTDIVVNLSSEHPRPGRPAGMDPAPSSRGAIAPRSPPTMRLVGRFLAERRSVRGDRGDLFTMLIAAHGTPTTNERDERPAVRDEIVTSSSPATRPRRRRWPGPGTSSRATRRAEAGWQRSDAARRPQPTLADLARLRYTPRVIEESMRLYPPALPSAAGDRRRTARRQTRPADALGHREHPGITHRHPLWPEPERFDPERFARGAARPRFAYMPFGGGPRTASATASRCRSADHPRHGRAMLSAPARTRPRRRADRADHAASQERGLGDAGATRTLIIPHRSGNRPVPLVTGRVD